MHHLKSYKRDIDKLYDVNTMEATAHCFQHTIHIQQKEYDDKEPEIPAACRESLNLVRTAMSGLETEFFLMD